MGGFRVRVAALAGMLAAAALAHAAAAATVSGRVRGQTGSALAGARVTLFLPDLSYFREVRSSAKGRYLIESVPPGSYRLGAELRGREYAEVELVVGASGVVRGFTLAPETQRGAWDVLARFEENTFGGTDSGVLLPDGRLLFCHDTIDPVLFDPVAAVATPMPASPRIQGCHAVRLLSDGRVLYVGGADRPVYGPGTRQVKAFDPATETWQVLPELTAERWYPTMVPLPGGALLAVGGGGLDNPQRVKTSEVMDPRTFTWKRVGDVALGNEVSPVVLLFTGEALMTHRPPQLFDPATGRWRRAADFVQGNRMPDGDHADHEVVLAADGRVVAIGYKSFTPGEPGRMVEIYDSRRDRWTLGASSTPVRSRPSIVQLPDQRVLVTGGFKEDARDSTPTNGWGYVALADLYDLARDSWRRVAPMNVAREYHSLPILVPDGRVITVGGEGQPGIEPDFNVVEAFRPPYLFRGVRPRIVSLASSTVQPGGTLTLEVDRTAAPTSIVLLGTAASTHFMDSGNARLLPLAFTRSGGGRVRARVPADPAVVLPGWYLLFALVDDIPSVGRIVRVR